MSVVRGLFEGENVEEGGECARAWMDGGQGAVIQLVATLQKACPHGHLSLSGMNAECCTGEREVDSSALLQS
jgi:hypothetical protein